jgi:hypothetical protein
MIKIGLKANAAFLFEAMCGNTLGGTTGGVEHRFIVHLNEDQFFDFKKLIKHYGYSVGKSLTENNTLDYNYSCYLVK